MSRQGVYEEFDSVLLHTVLILNFLLHSKITRELLHDSKPQPVKKLLGRLIRQGKRTIALLEQVVRSPTSTSRMSNQLIRRLLPQSNDLNNPTPNAGNLSKKRKRREKALDGSKLFDKDAIIELQVRSILQIDKAMKSTGSKGESLKRLDMQQNKEMARKKKARKVILGNSRSSAQQVKILREPTFNKKKYRKEREEERLKEIAKLLQKSAKAK